MKMSKVTAKYQITIPPRIRKELGIVPGMTVDIKKDGDRYFLHVNSLEGIKRKWRGRFRDRTSSDQYLENIRGSLE
jgi:AbrB family looped-hinge helix DNA binding protein